MVSRAVQKLIAPDCRTISDGKADLKGAATSDNLRPMLPVTLQFIIAMIAYAMNERMARRVDYLQEEVRVLKEALATATGKKRIDFTAEQRQRDVGAD